MTATAVIIVTHDSAEVLAPCLQALQGQSLRAVQVCLVDSGSRDPGYLDRLPGGNHVEVLLLRDNLGFAQANNAGYHRLKEGVEYVLFLNPDVLLAPGALARAEQGMRQDRGVGVLTGRLLGYDFSTSRPNGRLDSTGIFRKVYGRWYDRGQGEADRGQFARAEDVPAACGALMFCRREALDQVALAGGAAFDPGFFLYKEDIELCLRLRQQGWRIRYDPGIMAWHGRGWRQRSAMSRALRRTAAESELLLYRRHPSPYLLWALLKYVLVRSLGV